MLPSDKAKEIRRHSYELRRSGASGLHKRRDRCRYIPDEPEDEEDFDIFAWLDSPDPVE